MINLRNDIFLRWATSNEYDELGEGMFDAVRNGESPYSERQRCAWVSAPRKDKSWHDRLASQQIIMAVRRDNITGFMSLVGQGYIDFAYIRPWAQKSGLFRQLYIEIEREATRQQLDKLWVHASLQAQPAFTAMDFQIIETENVLLGGQMLKRYKMEKLISG